MQLLKDQSDAKLARIIKLDRQCSEDPRLFFNSFLYTFDPKREPYHLEFNTFPFQDALIEKLVRAIEMGYDIFVDKTREMGVTYTVLGVKLWYWKYQPAANFLLGSRKQDVVDNTGAQGKGESSNKEESLFGKMDYMLERVPSLILPDGFDTSKHRTFMSLRNPELGNVISGESSNPNFSRGSRFKAILLDEFAFWENDTAAWGSTADTTNCRIVVTTPGIRPNTKAKKLRFKKEGEEIEVVSLPYYLDPRKTPEWLEQQRTRRSAEDFAREIMIDWEGAVSGVVYPEAKQRVVGKFPYNPAWPLYITWDFGLDGTALQWWQPNPINGKKRLVDAYMNENHPIQWYFPLIGEHIDSKFQYSREELEAIERTKDYRKAVHFGDPDVKKRSMANEDLTSVREELEKIQVYVQTNTQSNSFRDRREKTKVMLQTGIEINDTPGTAVWIEALDGARYPKRNEDSQATSEIILPIHDWTSHPRTATEYFAVNYSEPEPDEEPDVPVQQTNFMPV
jgi:hypothetical protein